MIVHDGQNLISDNTHSDILPVDPFELEDVKGRFFGVEGEAEIRDAPNGRFLRCTLTYHNYDSAAELKTWLADLDGQINQITGKLVQSGNISTTYENCTFKGFHPKEPGVFYEPATQKWQVTGELRWRQLGRF